MKRFLTMLGLIAFLGIAWVTIPLLNHRDPVYEERLVGALKFVEQNIEYLSPERASADAFNSPSMQPGPRLGTWTVSGNVTMRSRLGGTTSKTYKAVVENTCPSYGQYDCWRLEKLTLSDLVLIDTSPTADKPAEIPQVARTREAPRASTESVDIELPDARPGERDGRDTEAGERASHELARSTQPGSPGEAPNRAAPSIDEASPASSATRGEPGGGIPKPPVVTPIPVPPGLDRPAKALAQSDTRQKDAQESSPATAERSGTAPPTSSDVPKETEKAQAREATPSNQPSGTGAGDDRSRQLALAPDADVGGGTGRRNILEDSAGGASTENKAAGQQPKVTPPPSQDVPPAAESSEQEAQGPAGGSTAPEQSPPDVATADAKVEPPAIPESATPRSAAPQIAAKPPASEPDAPSDTLAGVGESSPQENTPRSEEILVFLVQTGLQGLGLDPGPVDGMLGPSTRDAIEDYQREHGLALDGRPTQALLNHIEQELLSDSLGQGAGIELAQPAAPPPAPEADASREEEAAETPMSRADAAQTERSAAAEQAARVEAAARAVAAVQAEERAARTRQTARAEQPVRLEPPAPAPKPTRQSLPEVAPSLGAAGGPAPAEPPDPSGSGAEPPAVDVAALPVPRESGESEAAGSGGAVIASRDSIPAQPVGREEPASSVAAQPASRNAARMASIDRAGSSLLGTAMRGPAYAQAAVDAQNSGAVDRAIELYSLAIEAGDLSQDNLAAAYNNRGVAYRNQGLYERALDDYDTAIQLKDDYASAYYNRGIAYYNTGRYDQAFEDYEDAIRLDPNYANAYHNRAIIYGNEGSYDLAIEDLTRAIRLRPTLDYAYFNRGRMYEAKGDSERALRDFKKAYSLNPDQSEYRAKMQQLGLAQQTENRAW